MMMMVGALLPVHYFSTVAMQQLAQQFHLLWRPNGVIHVYAGSPHSTRETLLWPDINWNGIVKCNKIVCGDHAE